MDMKEAALLIAGIGTLFTLAFFLVISFVYPAGKRFFFPDEQLDASIVRSNTAATATSLAGAVFFFLSATPLFGWLMLLVPAFNAIGFYIFVRLASDDQPDPKTTGSVYRVYDC